MAIFRQRGGVNSTGACKSSLTDRSSKRFYIVISQSPPDEYASLNIDASTMNTYTRLAIQALTEGTRAFRGLDRSWRMIWPEVSCNYSGLLYLPDRLAKYRSPLNRHINNVACWAADLTRLVMNFEGR
ncbi:hypothetical protein HD806DRAFT_161444 [Xylariaceae sp. AK1471]|nr:hypothetical protein HD806DRAFT_161444 [Xylariaceae sp. AK1471]